MLVIQHPTKPPTARPMQIGDVDDDGTVWFLSKTGAPMMNALEQDPNVAFVCQGPHDFVSLSGIAEIFAFATKLATIWRSSFDRWFPEGPDTPDLVAFRVAPVEGDHWDDRGAHTHLEAR
jgi:general stress protein 26